MSELRPGEPPLPPDHLALPSAGSDAPVEAGGELAEPGEEAVGADLGVFSDEAVGADLGVSPPERATNPVGGPDPLGVRDPFGIRDPYGVAPAEPVAPPPARPVRSFPPPMPPPDHRRDPSDRAVRAEQGAGPAPDSDSRRSAVPSLPPLRSTGSAGTVPAPDRPASPERPPSPAPTGAEDLMVPVDAPDTVDPPDWLPSSEAELLERNEFDPQATMELAPEDVPSEPAAEEDWHRPSPIGPMESADADAPPVRGSILETDGVDLDVTSTPDLDQPSTDATGPLPVIPGPPTAGDATPPLQVQPAVTMAELTRSPVALPLLALAVGVAAVVLGHALFVVGIDIPLSGRLGLGRALDGFGAWSGLLVGLAAGVVQASRPVSRRASIGTAVLGGIVAAGGFLAFVLRITFEGGLRRMIETAINVMDLGPGVAMLLGGLAVVVALQGTEGDDRALTLPVGGLLAAAGVSVVTGIAAAFTDFVGPLSLGQRMTAALLAFDFRAALLVVAAGVLLAVFGRPRTGLHVMIVVAGAVIGGMTLLGLVASTLVSDEFGLRIPDGSAAPATLALAALAATLAFVRPSER